MLRGLRSANVGTFFNVTLTGSMDPKQALAERIREDVTKSMRACLERLGILDETEDAEALVQVTLDIARPVMAGLPPEGVSDCAYHVGIEVRRPVVVQGLDCPPTLCAVWRLSETQVPTGDLRDAVEMSVRRILYQFETAWREANPRN